MRKKEVMLKIFFALSLFIVLNVDCKPEQYTNGSWYENNNSDCNNGLRFCTIRFEKQGPQVVQGTCSGNTCEQPREN